MSAALSDLLLTTGVVSCLIKLRAVLALTSLRL